MWLKSEANIYEGIISLGAFHGSLLRVGMGTYPCDYKGPMGAAATTAPSPKTPSGVALV